MYTSSVVPAQPTDSEYATLHLNYACETYSRGKGESVNWITGYVLPIEDNSDNSVLPPNWRYYLSNYTRYTLSASSITVTALPSKHNYAICIWPWIIDHFIPNSFNYMTYNPRAVTAYVSKNSDTVTVKNYVTASELFGVDYGKDLKQHFVTPSDALTYPLETPDITHCWAWIIAYRFFPSADADESEITPLDLGLHYTFYTRWLNRRPVSADKHPDINLPDPS